MAPVSVSAGAPAPAQKQRINVYTVMLVISFICIVVACILLYMELGRWGNYPWWRTQEAVPRSAQLHVDPSSHPGATTVARR